MGFITFIQKKTDALGIPSINRIIKYLRRGYTVSVESVKNMEDNMNNTSVNTEGTEDAQHEETKTYSAEEVAKLIQAEADRRTNQALAKQKKEYEKKLSLSSLDEQQRKEAEAQMKIEELQEQLAQFTIERNRSELKSVLSGRGLSAEFADILLISDDLEASQANIDKLDKLFKAAVKAEVEKRLSSNGAPKGNGTSSTEITKESARKMSMAELNKLAIEQPELFKKLFG